MFNSILLNNFWGEIEMNAAGGAAPKTAAPATALARRWTGESSRSKAAAAPRLRADTQLGQIAKACQKRDFKENRKIDESYLCLHTACGEVGDTQLGLLK